MTARVLRIALFLMILIPLPGAAQDEIAGIPFADIPQEALDDSESFFNMCNANIKFSRRFQCECLATKYLEVRLLEGPEYPRQRIITDIDHLCPNAEEAAGEAFTECADYRELMPKDKPLGEFCRCYANTYADMREKLRVPLTTQASITLKTRAMNYCQFRP